MENNLSGLIAPLVTPFKRNGEIDFSLVKKEIHFLLDNGITSLSPGGSTGEGVALEDGEICSLITEIKKISPSIPVVAGIIRNSSRAAIRCAKALEKAGADALMITPVSYNILVPDFEGNYNYYNTIAKNTSLPIVIYNVVPQNTITPEMFLKLLEIDNVIAIKQSVGGISSFYEMLCKTHDKGKIFSATDEMMASTFELGADGAISAILSIFPKEMVQTWSLIQKGNIHAALEIQKKLYPVWKTIEGNQFPIRIKYTLKLLGIDCGFTRSPICHIAEEDQKRIYSALKKSKYIY